MKNVLFFYFFFFTFSIYTQELTSYYKMKRIAVKDTIRIDSFSINPSRFMVKNLNGKSIDSSWYSVNYAKAILWFNHPIDVDTIAIEYVQYAESVF